MLVNCLLILFTESVSLAYSKRSILGLVVDYMHLPKNFTIFTITYYFRRLQISPW